MATAARSIPVADLLGNIRARAELRADLRHERRVRARGRNAELRRTLVRPRSLAIAVIVAVAAVAALMIGRSLGADPTTRPAGLGVPQVDGGRLALAGWSGWLTADTPNAVRDLLPGAVAAKPLLLDGVTVLVGDVEEGDVPRLLSAVRSSDRGGSELSAGALRAPDLLRPARRPFAADGDGPAGTDREGRLGGDLPGRSAPQRDCRRGLPLAAPVDDDASQLVGPWRRARRSRPPMRWRSPSHVSTASAERTCRRWRRLPRAAARHWPLAGSAPPTPTRLAPWARISFTTLAQASGAALVDRLAAGRDAYRALAAAAASTRRRGFAAARERAITTDAAIARSLAQLGRLGYRR